MTYTVPGNFDSQIYSSTFFAQIFNFGPDHTARATKYQNCWDFYAGKHWTQKAPEGFDQITINYAKTFVKKIRRFAFRNGWTMVFTPEQIADGIDKWVGDVWKANDLKGITNDIADFGGIFGDWFVYPQWDSAKAVLEGADYIGKPEEVKLVALDPRFVFPQYNNKTGEMDFCIILIPYTEFELVNNEFDMQQRVYREVHTKEKIFVQEMDEKNSVLAERVIENPLNKMLIIHGIHQPQAGSYFGEGIIEDMVEGNKLFNEKTSDISDIIDYHAAPITLIFGAKARQLEKGANKIWSGLPANAKVENLSSPGNIEAAREFVADVKGWMHEMSGIPEGSLSPNTKVSNTSATALAIDFEPIIELAEDVQFYFDHGIKKVNELIIDIGKYIGTVKTKLEAPILYEHHIEHGTLLPRDRSIDLADITTELNSGLESKRGAMQRLGVKNIDAKIEEILKEQEQEKKTAMELAKKYMDPAMVDQIGNAGNLNKPPDPFQKNTGTTPAAKKATKASNKNPVVHGQQVVNANVQKTAKGT